MWTGCLDISIRVKEDEGFRRMKVSATTKISRPCAAARVDGRPLTRRSGGRRKGRHGAAASIGAPIAQPFRFGRSSSERARKAEQVAHGYLSTAGRMSRGRDSHVPKSGGGEGVGSTTAASQRLLVVGPGVLGKLIARNFKETHASDAWIVGETATDLNHDSLRGLDYLDEVRDREGGQQSQDTYPNVVFSAPPSGSENYLEEVERAVNKWDGTGTLLFTSSAAVYDLEQGPCTEDSKVKKMGDSERTDKLLACENAVLEKGGNVVRLVGLYHSKRGAHMYFLKVQTVPRWGDSLINLIHYEDAAELSCKILEGSQKNGEKALYRGQVFLGCDNHPISFQNMMDATFLSGEYKGQCKFTGEEKEFAGKEASNNLTRETLDWTPKYESYQAFMKQGAKDTF